MTELFGLSQGAALNHVGGLHQVARIDEFTEDAGPLRGARRIRIVTGGGIEIEVHPDRCMDLGQVTAWGIPVAWIGAAGILPHTLYEPVGTAWLRTFGGGLLATCGLDTFGPPGHDGGEDLGMHGRVGATSAWLMRAEVVGDTLTVSGEIRQFRVFGENLRLRRTISARLGSSEFSVADTVTNDGALAQPHMVLYHLNFGWPLVAPGAELIIPSVAIEPRDDDARAGTDSWGTIHAPTAGYREQVFIHTMPYQALTALSLANKELGLRVDVSFDTTTLPVAYQWKMLGEKTYVVGLEPANCEVVAGRAAARAAGVLPELAPGESVEYRLDFHFGSSR